MQKLMYMKKHDQTICSSLKEVYNSVPCPNTLFLSPGNIYHTTWLGWAPLCILKIQIMPSVIRSMTASSQLHNFGSSRSAPRQAQPSPKCRHRAAGLSHCYPIEKEISVSQTAHALKNKAGTGSSPVARVKGATSLCFTSAGTERGQCSQCCWHAFLWVQQCNLKAHFPASGNLCQEVIGP